MIHRKENSPPLPGVWQTIAAGFDLTSKRLWLLILPFLLDCFLWLGPRLSGRLILERLVTGLPADPALAEIQNQILTLAPRTNLFTSLSVALVGVPALMVGAAPEKTPVPTAVIELDSVGLWVGLFVVFSLVGVLLTAVYFTLIAQEVGQFNRPPAEAGKRLTGPALLGRIGRTWLQFLGLGLLILVMGFVVYLPLLPISLVASLLSVALGILVLFMGPVFLLWVIIYLFFAPHGLAMHGRSLYQAAVDSLQLVRAYMLSVLGLLLAVFIIRNLVATLLLLADDGSWLTLGGILGHAFVTTSLVTATFIFYRDRYPLVMGAGRRQPSSTLEQTLQ